MAKINKKRKEKQHIHVQNALSIESRTQSPVMCFWGERRLKIREKVEANSDWVLVWSSWPRGFGD